ncbi:MAG: MotA/TolQ/ExbB proton channel family protein [Candidatus Hydrogenedentes bacterium]|nr:MotA/TolQ/ExbB proton channel family protein [Candidatus Hydrogenedentota bacterium]
MDIATIIGIVAGVTLVLMAIISDIGLYINAPSMLIVVGGTMGATLMNFPLADVLGVFGTAKNAFLHKAKSPVEIISIIVDFATAARREGILALEARASEAGDPFLEKSVQLAVDGTAPELIKDILTTELAFLEERHSIGQGVFIAMGTFAPAFGMIGTLIGLIKMLSGMDDPSAIGPGMALALLTTLYGAIIANMFCMPIAGKLKVRTQMEMLIKEVIIEGILSIQSGDNPRVVEQKLMAFIPPSMRNDRAA